MRDPEDCRDDAMELLQITVRLPQAFCDALIGTLHDLGFQGMQELESGIRVWMSDDPQSLHRLGRIQEYLGSLRQVQHELEFTIDVLPTPTSDWVSAVHESFQPVLVSPRIAIRPSWTGYEPGPDVAVMVIDPKMAFGTGAHETTRLALRLLDDLFHERRVHSVLDVGCGTGVLSIAAGMLKARRIVACDTDPDAVVATEENAAINNIELEVLAGSAEDVSGSYDLVLANINWWVLTKMAPLLAERTAHSLVLSGITEDRIDALMETYARLGLRESARLYENEWTAVRLDRF